MAKLCADLLFSNSVYLAETLCMLASDADGKKGAMLKDLAAYNENPRADCFATQAHRGRYLVGNKWIQL